VEFIPQVEPYLTEAEARAAAEYLRSGGWLTEFRQTERLVEMVTSLVGARHGAMVTSGTVALYLALKALGLGPGDEVVVPNYTMIATINAVVWVGARPVLADVEPDTLCLDLETVRLCRHTRALIYVPINGRHGDMARVVEFCREHGLYLVEDAAQALGARAGDKYLGTFGDIGVYSFTPHKIVTTGQGGMLVTDDDELIGRIRKLKDFHRTAPASDWHDGVGFNFKFTDLQAVVGIEQMKTIAWRVQRKKEIYARYQQGLSGCKGVEMLPTDLEECPPWFVDVLLPDQATRDELVAFLKERGIGSRPFYPPLSFQPMYQELGRGSFPVSEELAPRGLWLPSSLGLSDEQIQHVCQALAERLG
jgi:perosamine synthetase